jgi:hypothetical protein
MRKRLFLISALLVFTLLVAAGVGSASLIPDATTSAPASFVTSSGTELRLDGQPYRFTGLNVYNATSVGDCWYTLGRSGAGLGPALYSMGPGNEVFRTWFFQPQATTDGERDWRAFDHVLGRARKRGFKVIPTLVNQWGQCEGWSAYTDGYKSESWYRSGYRTSPSSPGMPATYRDWVAEVVTRYRDNPEILAWQLVNEAEAKTAYDGSCSETASATLRSFAADMAGLVKSIDQNHLLSLGTIGTGQCGAAGDAYKDLHSVPGIDLCEYHDYQPGAMPGDEWNGLAVRLRQCRELGKPLFVGEVGIETAGAGGLIGRAGLLAAKLDAQFRAGVVGVLAWNWRDEEHGGSSLDGYAIGPGDPALAVLGAY